jgi:hypothetical protein
MNKFLGLGFGLVRSDTYRSAIVQVKLVRAIAAVLALSTTCADAARRDVRKVSRPSAHQVNVATLPIHVAHGASYWEYRLCSFAARARDPDTVCFLPPVRPYRGHDPDSHVRFELRRDFPLTRRQPAESDGNHPGR